MHARQPRVDIISSEYGVYGSVMESRQIHADVVLLQKKGGAVFLLNAC